MPLYLYENRRTGQTVELFRRVAERHDVPKCLRMVVAAPGHGGVDRKLVSERDPDRAVPRAFTQLSNNDVHKFVKESGFSIDHVKRVWQM